MAKDYKQKAGFFDKKSDFVEKFTTQRCKCGELRYNHVP